MSNTPIAIVTGAAKGIGRAIAERLANDGFDVLAVDMEPVSEDLPSAAPGAGKILFQRADIRDEQAVQALFRTAMERHGRVDAVVNNAGIIRDNMIHRMTLEDFQSVIDVNLKGTWLMCREAARVMKEQGSGGIVNIASRAWLGNRGQSNYAASKAGVVALTRVLALELGRHGVSVNTVAPGLIDTPLTRGLEPHVLQSLIDAQPTRTMGKPEDVAHAVAFLLNKDTRFITGQTLYVDGGKSIGAGI